MGKISTRAKNFPENPIRGMEPLVKNAKSLGIDVIPLNIGAPDTESPIESKKAITKFLKENKSIPYGPSVGNYKLINELSSFYSNKLGFKNITQSSIAVTQGASEALELVMYSVADKGETILTFDPGYPNYFAIAYKYGITVETIETNIENSFHFDYKNLDKAIPNNIKAILWSSPSNPTGAVYTKEELQALIEISRKRDIWLIADEVYRSLDFNNQGKKFSRSLSILDVAKESDLDRIIVLDSMSKLLGLCGARIGTILANPDMIQTIVSQASVRGSASTISQAGIEIINDIPDNYYITYREEFKQRRDYLYTQLKKLKRVGVKVSPYPPEGAFYMIADIGVNAYNFSKWLITDYPKKSGTKETVFLTPMVTPTGGFYKRKEKGINQVRIAYVINKSLLKRAVKIIENGLKLFDKR